MPSNQVCDSAPMAQRALPSAIDDLQRAVTGLESTIYNLKSQLHPLLDEVLEGIEGKGQAVAAPYHYSSQISDLTSRVRALSSLGNDMITRLHA